MNRKQEILEEITKPACVSGEHPEDFGDVILSPYRLADYLLRLEEKMGKKSFKMEINEKGRFAPVSQEKDDLESRFSGLPWYWASAPEKVDIVINKRKLLDFIREEGERRYREGHEKGLNDVIINFDGAYQKGLTEGKQAGRKELLDEVNALAGDCLSWVGFRAKLRKLL